MGDIQDLSVIGVEKEQKLKLYFMKKLVLAALVFSSVAAKAQTAGMTIQQQIDWLQRARQVHFVYDSTLPLGQIYEGPSLLNLTTDKALK